MTTTLVRADATPPSGPRRSASTRRRERGKLVPLLLMLAGVLVLLYPVVATQYNNVKQREFALEYNNEVLASNPMDLSADLAAARSYNKTLEGVPILDPWLLKVAADPGSKPYIAYRSTLDRFDVMARVKVPKAGIDLPVYHGTSDDVIAKGAGHLYGTSLPVGGEDTHAVLTSHTGMANATLFDHLTEVAEGDLMFIEVFGETLAYKVDQIKVVLPNEISDLTTVQGHDYLTLFTCTPYAVNTHRLLVRGVRVPYTPEAAEIARPQRGDVFKMEPWMYWLIGAAVAGLTLFVVVVVREHRRSRDAVASQRSGSATSQRASTTGGGRRFLE